MREIHRREFAKRAAMAVVLGPAALGKAVSGRRVAQSDASRAEPSKLKLTSKQEEDVKRAVERRNQQLASMRGHVLPYDLEPAFVFAAWTRPRIRGKP